MTLYIRRNDRKLFKYFTNSSRENILNSAILMVDNIILTNNLTDLDKTWGLLSDEVKKSYFSNYVNLFYDYRINTVYDDKISEWENKFLARLFLYLDEKQVWNTFNSLSYDTEGDRYTLTKWRSFDERHKDGTVDKITNDQREYDYPQYTTDVITPPLVPNLTIAGAIINNENSLAGVLTSVNINDDKSVSDRTTIENQTVNTTSGDSDQKESWSIPKEVINFATQRFNQMATLKPIDKTDYYNWMLPLFCTFFTQSGEYE